MIIAAQAEFTSEYPEDWDEEAQDFIGTPGLTTASAIVEMLKRLGCSTKEISDGGNRGWEFGAKYKNRDFWFGVGIINDMFITSRESLPFLHKLRKIEPLSPELLTQLNAEMAKDPRLGPVRWFSSGDFLADVTKGSEQPILDNGE